MLNGGLENDKNFTMDEEQYRDILRILNEEIYKYAEHQGIDLGNEEELIRAGNTLPKINLGKEITEFLLEGIMHYDVGDQRVLKFIDLEGISFAGKKVRNVDFRGTNANIDPQTVDRKNIEGANFEGIDMRGKCFDGCAICGADLSHANATINPQNVYDKSLARAKCDGLDFSGADFTDVYVVGTSFKDAKIDLDPQKVRGKDLTGVNLENVDMSGKSFNGCRLMCCNLTNTNAVLDLRCSKVSVEFGCKLEGTTLIVDEHFDREVLEKNRLCWGI